MSVARVVLVLSVLLIPIMEVEASRRGGGCSGGMRGGRRGGGCSSSHGGCYVQRSCAPSCCAPVRCTTSCCTPVSSCGPNGGGRIILSGPVTSRPTQTEQLRTAPTLTEKDSDGNR